ncbi:Putative protein similar of AD/FMN-containing dehydrogenases of Aspergillus oryzae [Podospora comata]|uniref:FAD-binding PCMH-type domain-containing protein n=1 Tax=Podospora comata TaxID=48703 RepID=A0ABY6S5H5_PODCO|nr:Putative protein similar of AD/FMN-containing dehydrogenases of Aspergillus oryzae [Podospora comata]
MIAVSLSRALLLAGTFARLGLAQTEPTILAEDGSVLSANETTVAPAAEVEVVEDAGEVLLLTDAVLANLTALDLSDINLFTFDEEVSSVTTKRSFSRGFQVGDCKVFPGDRAWPSRLSWTVFNLLTGGALIETVPIGAVCYPNSGVYNAAKCQYVLANWAQSALHASDPTSVMSPLYQGETCMPQNGQTGTCEMGSFPSYSVKIHSVYQVQLAVNFARNQNLRLVVHNTGHDFLGKSTGAGALSIWTHNLKDIKYVKSFRSPSYNGPALKLGAGVQVGELYAAANSLGVTAVGGECPGVGVAGGYLAGGGHSPLSSKYGLGSDQVLSIDVVLPNGRFVTATETKNTDLFWALRGGGGGTFGVVTSITVKVHPKQKFAGFSMTLNAGPESENSIAVFWQAMYAYWRKFPDYAAQGVYGYSTVFPLFTAAGGYSWTFHPFMMPNMTLAQFKVHVQPLLDEWTAMGLAFTPNFFEKDNLYDVWTQYFPAESVANSNMRTASRMFPASVWNNSTNRDALFDEMRAVVEEGSALIQYNMNPRQTEGTPNSAANSHWRDAIWFAIMGAGWAPGTPEPELAATNNKITHDWMERLRAWGPGGYGNEGDVMEPNFGEAFFGTNYQRLLRIKREVDPNDLFWAPTAVGAERWTIQGQPSWLTTQVGKLCKISN